MQLFLFEVWGGGGKSKTGNQRRVQRAVPLWLVICHVTYSSAMVFPVVMYCESWTIRKAECQRTDAFVVLEKTLESPLDCKEIKRVTPKGNQS